MSNLSIIFGGDIVPSFDNLDSFANGNVAGIADEKCQEVLNSANYRVYNLETPLTDCYSPIPKEGANFSVPSSCINGLKKINPNIISIANNHCKDHGVQAFLETIKTLESNNISVLGYGTNFKECKMHSIISENNLKIGIIACAETEFTIWENNELGAVPYDSFWINNNIRELKKSCDAVIVIYHGGKEHFPYPAPYLLERCHLMADNGADVILCQHSHCIGCYENYNSATIVYGQGNFIFHQKNDAVTTKEGLLVKVDISKGEKTVSFIPVVLNSNDVVCLAKDNDFSRIMDQFKYRSEQIENQYSVNEIFSKYADKHILNYFGRIKKESLFEKILRKCKLSNFENKYSEKELLYILNLLQNEAHRETFAQGIKNMIRRKQK